MQKCSELESQNAELESEKTELEKKIEEKDLRIEHLTELVLKRNKMLFGQKSEKAKFINDGQLAFEGIFNEAEAESDKSAAEPTIEKVTRKSKKTGQHCGRKEIRADLETKKIVYELSYGSGNYESAGCWAHARRKFVDSIPAGDTSCPSAQIVALIDKAAELEREAKKAGYTGKQILEMRQKEIKPLLDQVYEKIEKLRPGKGSHLYAAVTYARNQKDKLYLFLSNADVEMTNNLAERTVKPYVINRKNFLFSDTEKGADASAAVMSIIETAKRNRLDVYGYLLHLLTVLPEWGASPTDEQIKSVMPWSMALPAYCKQTYSEIQ